MQPSTGSISPFLSIYSFRSDEVTVPDDTAKLSTDKLVRPILNSYLKTSLGKQNRLFSSNLYSRFNLVENSRKTNAVFTLHLAFSSQALTE